MGARARRRSNRMVGAGRADGGYGGAGGRRESHPTRRRVDATLAPVKEGSDAAERGNQGGEAGRRVRWRADTDAPKHARLEPDAEGRSHRGDLPAGAKIRKGHQPDRSLAAPADLQRAAGHAGVDVRGRPGAETETDR